MSRRAVTFLFCFFVVYLTLFYRVGELPFFGADEPRYARIAEEMLASGDWVTPTLEGRPWLEKPPLLFWLEALSFRLFGISEWAARLPSALLAVLSSLGVAYLIGRFVGVREGVLTFLVLTSTPMFALFGRAASTDMALASTLTLAFVSALIVERSASQKWAVATGAFLGLAVLAKGPVAILLFVVTWGLYLFFVNRWRFSRLQLILMGGSFSLISLPWYVAAWWQNGWNFAVTFWLNHHLARFVTTVHHHEEPFWFYLLVLLVGLFPWVFFLGSFAASLIRNGRNLLRASTFRENDRLSLEVYLLLWAVFPLAFFSLSSSKLPGYILPCFPPLAAIIGLQWERFLRDELMVFKPMRIQLSLLGAFSVLLSLVLIIGFHLRYDALSVGVIVAAPILLGVLLAHREFRMRRTGRLFVTLVAATTMTLALLYWQAGPIIGRYHSAKELSRIAEMRASDENPLIFYRFFHHTARYYTDFRTTREAVHTPQELEEYMDRNPQEHYLLLTKKEGWRELAEFPAVDLVAVRGDFYLVQLSAETFY